MRIRLYWNDDWGFAKEYSDRLRGAYFSMEDLEPVRLPHSNVVTSYNYLNEDSYQMVCGYRREFFGEGAWVGKTLRLTFEGAAHYCEVFLNGEAVATHMGGYTAFTIDLTERINLRQKNVLTVKLDSSETLNEPPFGHVVDYLTYGGLYREVYLDVLPPVYVKDVFVTTARQAKACHMLQLQATLSAPGPGYSFLFALTDPDGALVHLWRQDDLQGTRFTVNELIKGVTLWTLKHPYLYLLTTTLWQGRTKLDETQVRFGFRTAEFCKEGFFLNGRRITLRGLNRHQSYPYVGYAMPKRVQRTDADLLKYELGVNAVRTSHYPQSQHFLDRCDEIGLLVFTELPGWQYIGDAVWKKEACLQLTEMVLQYRNHPSIILWGVRINESQDDDAFYQKTNALAHSLDPSRQTSGVRFISQSSLLEDVYAYNDFVHNGTNRGVDKRHFITPDPEKPYLISEYNGHMFPTKSFDNESRRLEHALRHARVMNDYYAQPEIAGGFGWCMFDYNTHKDFGSGDRICYHGVMDSFRNPKLAAAVYASQQNVTPVLEISANMDIGEHSGGHIDCVYAFTNAHSVRVYKNDQFIKEFYPDKKHFPHMPHPPVRIDDFVGGLLEKGEGLSHTSAEIIKRVLAAAVKYGERDLPVKYRIAILKIMAKEKLTLSMGADLYRKYMVNWGGTATSYRFEAMVGQRVVKTVVKTFAEGVVLQVNADTTILTEETGYDVASVRIQARDKHGNALPYYQSPLSLTTTGALEIIGPRVISLPGGMGGTYVRTTAKEGSGTLTCCGTDGLSSTLSFTIVK